MTTAISTTDLDDSAFAPSPTGPALNEFNETTDGSTIPVNSILARKRTPNQHRGRLVLVAGISMLALVGVAAGALAVMSHPTKPAIAPAPLSVQSVVTPAVTPSAGGAAIAPTSTPTEPGATTSTATTRETSTAVAPAAPIARRSRLSPPATAPLPNAGPSDAVPAARQAPAPIVVTPPTVAAQPETPAVNQMSPVVGPSTAPTPPPAQPVTPQSATPQPQPATPQPQPQPQTISDETAAPTLAKLPLSAIMSQRT
jgi:hypothetical protein